MGWGKAGRREVVQVGVKQQGKQWSNWVQNWWTCGRAGWDKAGECESEQVYKRQVAHVVNNLVANNLNSNSNFLMYFFSHFIFFKLL